MREVFKKVKYTSHGPRGAQRSYLSQLQPFIPPCYNEFDTSCKTVVLGKFAKFLDLQLFDQ